MYFNFSIIFKLITILLVAFYNKVFRSFDLLFLLTDHKSDLVFCLLYYQFVLIQILFHYKNIFSVALCLFVWFWTITVFIVNYKTDKCHFLRSFLCKRCASIFLTLSNIQLKKKITIIYVTSLIYNIKFIVSALTM